MNQMVPQDFQATHPLAGVEGWPATGPVYGLADDETAPRAATLTFWERVGERFRKSPTGEAFNRGQVRIWY